MNKQAQKLKALVSVLDRSHIALLCEALDHSDVHVLHSEVLPYIDD